MLDLNHPDGEWINPEYAIEPGTRRGHEEIRRAIERIFEFFETVEVAADSGGGFLGAAVGLEAVDVQAEVPGPLPQVGVLEAALVGVERVVQLPEAPLARGGLGGARTGPGARVLGAHGEVTEDPPD